MKLREKFKESIDKTEQFFDEYRGLTTLACAFYVVGIGGYIAPKINEMIEQRAENCEVHSELFYDAEIDSELFHEAEIDMK